MILFFGASALMCVAMAVFLAGQFLIYTRKKYFFNFFVTIFVIILMFIAYHSFFGDGGDIYRYYRILDDMQGKSYIWALEKGYYKDNFITNTLFWLVSTLGEKRLLPLISTGLIMGNIFGVISEERKRTKASPTVFCMYLTCLFAVLTLPAILTGVRQSWMLSVFLLAVYRDLIKGKKDVWTILLYISSIMIHSAALFLVFIRLSLGVKGKLKFLLVGWSCLLPIARVFSNFEGVIGNAAQKLIKYQEISDFDIRLVYATLGVLFTIIFIVVQVKKREPNNRYVIFVEHMILFTIGSFPVQHLFMRQVNALIIILLPLLILFYKYVSFKTWRFVTIVNSVFCIGLFAYQIVFAINYWTFI